MKISVILQQMGPRDVATIRPDQTVADASRLLSDRRIGAVVVSRDARRIDGILSERDIVRRLGAMGEDCLSMTVAEVMTDDVRTCTEDDTAIALLSRMTRGRFRHMPVVGPDGDMIAIVSIGDIVKARLEEMERENRAMAEMLSH